MITLAYSATVKLTFHDMHLMLERWIAFSRVFHLNAKLLTEPEQQFKEVSLSPFSAVAGQQLKEKQSMKIVVNSYKHEFSIGLTLKEKITQTAKNLDIIGIKNNHNNN